LPEEIRQAKWVVRERERILDEAKTEAEEMKEDARSKIIKLAQESEVVKEAKLQSEEIIAEAYKTASEIKSGAHQYADDVLFSVESRLQRTLAIIDEGRSELKGKLPRSANEIKSVG